MTTIGREALTEIDLLIAQGADFRLAIRYSRGDTPVDLNTWQARTQLRRKHGGDIWLTVHTGIDSPASLSLDNAGMIILDIPATVTEDPAWNTRSKLVSGEPQPTGVWDLELIDPDGAVIRIAQGTVTVSPDVTRTP